MVVTTSFEVKRTALLDRVEEAGEAPPTMPSSHKNDTIDIDPSKWSSSNFVLSAAWVLLPIGTQ
jgi:hypothetical protein